MASSNDHEPSPIAAVTRQCMTIATRISTLPASLPDPDTVQVCHLIGEQLGRLKIWAGNIGAAQNAHIKTSLQYRVRDAPKIANYIMDLLLDLAEDLNGG